MQADLPILHEAALARASLSTATPCEVRCEPAQLSLLANLPVWSSMITTGTAWSSRCEGFGLFILNHELDTELLPICTLQYIHYKSLRWPASCY